MSRWKWVMIREEELMVIETRKGIHLLMKIESIKDQIKKKKKYIIKNI
jgi:hypothetical protein